ncbi:MAG: hypothetical protein A2Y62_14675 [Candidatus Fischerbacteria bacterium RBG_13_37_8]|uniref:DUF4230 domain-containing protein n=1 Tax=Candidatus Fischerbacteria bacterium RBG_13_37_8 TaxID=1817863 RepID=A0A1F5VMU3_9BACT|nr:MAG: hypothetical protein A2Y62_14675 [Candidatus Fischerbacteria bacterium RBG_13_37_8]
MEKSDHNSNRSVNERNRFRIIITVIIVAGVVAITIGLYTVYRFTELPVETIDKAGESLAKIASTFKTGTVTTEFHDYVTNVRGVNYLQIANLKSVDTFTRTDSTAIFWDMIGLPDITVEIQAPIEYTYYLDLNDRWEFTWDQQLQSIIVIAPPIKCNTPAVDIANLKMIVKDGSILRNKELALEKLKKEMPQMVRGVAAEKIPLIRETARREARIFIENWIVKIMFKEYEFKPHVREVYFRDESGDRHLQIYKNVNTHPQAPADGIKNGGKPFKND